MTLSRYPKFDKIEKLKILENTKIKRLLCYQNIPDKMIYNKITLLMLILLVPCLLFSQKSFSGLYSDSVKVSSIFTQRSKNQVVKSYWVNAAIVPSTLVLIGGVTLIARPNTLISKYSIHNEILKEFSTYKSSMDNYLQFVPLATSFGLNLSGIKGRSDLINLSVISVKAEILMTLVVRGIKAIVPTSRPYGGKDSMPSGHTAQAFVSATILDMEYRDKSPWISVAGYAAATTTGMYRMINNMHWISDVLVGAGIGIFSAKAVYYTHRYKWGRKDNMVLVPFILKNGGGVSIGVVI